MVRLQVRNKCWQNQAGVHVTGIECRTKLQQKGNKSILLKCGKVQKFWNNTKKNKNKNCMQEEIKSKLDSEKPATILSRVGRLPDYHLVKIKRLKNASL